MDPRSALYLGFDVGTQGTKGVAIDASAGRVVARAGRAYELLPALEPGAAEQDPELWIGAVAEVSRALLCEIDATRVAGIGVSGQQHGAVLVDAAGRPVRPAKLWCDTATAEEAERLGKRLGRRVPVGFTASKLLYTREREPELWSRTAHVLLPHDYVNYRLTGVLRMEPGDASGTGLFYPVRRSFDPAAVAAVDPGLHARLPPVRESREPTGALSAEGAALLGLAPGALVAAGGGDNMLSAIGSGATREGVVVVSLGTSGTVFCHSAEPVLDPEALIAPFCDSTGGYLPLLCTMNATRVAEAVRRSHGRTLDELTALAAAVPAGCDGMLFLPYLGGERVPDLPRATGALLGLTDGALEPGRLFRAALEGATLALTSGVERLKRLGVPVEAVRVVGGGSANPLWCQILADALAVPVVRLEEPESAAFGAALQALWTCLRADGQRVSADDVASAWVHEAGSPFEPDERHVGVYADARARFEAATAALFGAGGVPRWEEGATSRLR